MRALVKAGTLRMAALGGLFTLARRYTRHRFRIFAYHGVASDIDPRLNFDGFFVSPQTFEAHLRTLKGHYQVMALSNIVRAVQSGEPLPDNATAITFDDGYANNAEIAAPLLSKYGLPATFFVTTGFLDRTHSPWWFEIRDAGCRMRDAGYVRWCMDVERRLKSLSSIERQQHVVDILSRIPDHESRIPPFMTWDQIRALAAGGHEIGAHTVSHISLGHESAEVVEKEIADSLARIRDEVGMVSPVYSYPYGEDAHFDTRWKEILRKQGCLGGVTTREGMNLLSSDPFRLKRLNVTGNHDRYAFRALASGIRTLLGRGAVK